MLDLLGDVTGKDLLDAGCGSGLYAAELARRGARVTGFDQSAQLVALAQERLGASATIHHADLDHELSRLPDASQDLALAEFVEAGFVIEALVEPRPLPEMADRYPDVHTQLMREPGFQNS